MHKNVENTLSMLTWRTLFFQEDDDGCISKPQKNAEDIKFA